MGFERVEKMYTGAAPLSSKVKQFFASLNMPLMNTYGLSETAGPTTYMDSNYFNQDSAGIPFPGTDIKIYNPDE